MIVQYGCVAMKDYGAQKSRSRLKSRDGEHNVVGRRGAGCNGNIAGRRWIISSEVVVERQILGVELRTTVSKLQAASSDVGCAGLRYRF